MLSLLATQPTEVGDGMGASLANIHFRDAQAGVDLFSNISQTRDRIAQSHYVTLRMTAADQVLNIGVVERWEVPQRSQGRQCAHVAIMCIGEEALCAARIVFFAQEFIQLVSSPWFKQSCPQSMVFVRHDCAPDPEI